MNNVSDSLTSRHKLTLDGLTFMLKSVSQPAMHWLICWCKYEWTEMLKPTDRKISKN